MGSLADTVDPSAQATNPDATPADLATPTDPNLGLTSPDASPTETPVDASGLTPTETPTDVAGIITIDTVDLATSDTTGW